MTNSTAPGKWGIVAECSETWLEYDGSGGQDGGGVPET
jgi:hypothetical protein